MRRLQWVYRLTLSRRKEHGNGCATHEERTTTVVAHDVEAAIDKVRVAVPRFAEFTVTDVERLSMVEFT